MESICRFCEAKITLKPARDCPLEWLDRLAPLVICNRCADWKRATQRHEDKIMWCAGRLLIERSRKEQDLKVVEEYSEKLHRESYSWVQCQAEYMHKGEVDPSKFYQAILKEPERAWQKMRDFREFLSGVEEPDTI